MCCSSEGLPAEDPGSAPVMDRPGAQLGSGHTEGTRDFAAVGGAAASASESCLFL